MMIPLFEHYPLLKDRLLYVSLGEFTTPVEKLDRLGRDIDLDHLYIKRDDRYFEQEVQPLDRHS